MCGCLPSGCGLPSGPRLTNHETLARMKKLEHKRLWRRKPGRYTMALNELEKQSLKQALVDCLRSEQEVRRIVIFGSFLSSADPHDLDVAVFQDSAEDYLPLALKYRRKTRTLARRIALDILPLKLGAQSDPFLAEAARGEVIYER